jgi:hypothetical protein
MPPVQKQTTHHKTVAVASECLESLSAFTSDETLDDTDPDNVPPPPTGSTKDNIVYYVSGFVVRRMRKVVSCDSCVSQLTSAAVQAPYTALINVKLRGALNWPSKILFTALLDVENTVAMYINSSLSVFMFSSIMEETLPSMIPVRAVLCDQHRNWVSAEILVYCISTRLHWHAKAVNRDAASRKMTKQNRKKSKLC